MPATRLQIVAPQVVPAAGATSFELYESTDIKTQIDALTIVNTGAVAAMVSVYFVPDGGTLGDTNALVKNLSIPALYTWNGVGVVGQMLAKNNTLQIVASVANILTVTATGSQISP